MPAPQSDRLFIFHVLQSNFLRKFSSQNIFSSETTSIILLSAKYFQSALLTVTSLTAILLHVALHCNISHWMLLQFIHKFYNLSKKSGITPWGANQKISSRKMPFTAHQFYFLSQFSITARSLLLTNLSIILVARCSSFGTFENNPI